VNEKSRAAAAILGAVMPVDEQPREEPDAEDTPKGGLFDGGARQTPPVVGDPAREHDLLLVQVLGTRTLTRSGDAWFQS
jgi:hypothetical protein